MHPYGEAFQRARCFRTRVLTPRAQAAVRGSLPQEPSDLPLHRLVAQQIRVLPVREKDAVRDGRRRQCVFVQDRVITRFQGGRLKIPARHRLAALFRHSAGTRQRLMIFAHDDKDGWNLQGAGRLHRSAERASLSQYGCQEFRRRSLLIRPGPVLGRVGTESVRFPNRRVIEIQLHQTTVFILKEILRFKGTAGRIERIHARKTKKDSGGQDPLVQSRGSPEEHVVEVPDPSTEWDSRKNHPADEVGPSVPSTQGHQTAHAVGHDLDFSA